MLSFFPGNTRRNFNLCYGSVAIAQKNHNFRLYQRDFSHHNRQLFVVPRNLCEMVLQGALPLFAERIGHCIASSNFSSRDYWRLSNSVLNESEFSILSLLSQFEGLSTSPGKAVCFAFKFFLNSLLDSSVVSLPNLPLRTKSPLSNIHITLYMVTDISNLYMNLTLSL